MIAALVLCLILSLLVAHQAGSPQDHHLLGGVWAQDRVGSRDVGKSDDSVRYGNYQERGEEEMSYKSTRILIEAVNDKMSVLRRCLSASEPSSSNDSAQDALLSLRKLVDELGAKAVRTSIEDVGVLPPDEYVAAMKPLVRTYHQQLHLIDRLASCLCEDLRFDACVVLLVGSDKTLVRTAHDPSKPEAERAAEMILAALDAGMKEHPVPPSGEERALLEEADRVGWDTSEGEELRRRAKEVRRLGSVQAIDVSDSDDDDPDVDYLGPDIGGEQ